MKKRMLAGVLSAAFLLLCVGCTAQFSQTENSSPVLTLPSGSSGSGLFSTETTSRFAMNEVDASFETDTASTQTTAFETTESSYIDTTVESEETSASTTEVDQEEGVFNGFAGKTFVILTSEAATGDIYRDGAESIHEAFDQCIEAFEEQYGCQVQARISIAPDRDIEIAMLTQKSDIDLYTSFCYEPFATKNAHNLYYLGIDFSEDFWDGSFVQANTVKTQSGTKAIYSALGDFAFHALASTEALFCDASLFEELFPETDLKTEVLEGRFTVDAFSEMLAVAYQNGKIGLAVSNGSEYARSLVVSAGLPVMENENDAYVFSASDERELWKSVMDNAISLWNAQGADSTSLRDFSVYTEEHRAVFYMGTLAEIDMLGLAADTLCILPYPRHDGADEGYAVLSDDTLSAYAVPKCAPDAVLSARFFEKFARFYSETLASSVKDYYSEKFGGTEMIELIEASRVYDPAFFYFKSMGKSLSDAVMKGSPLADAWFDAAKKRTESLVSDYMNDVKQAESE